MPWRFVFLECLRPCAYLTYGRTAFSAAQKNMSEPACRKGKGDLNYQGPGDEAIFIMDVITMLQ